MADSTLLRGAQWATLGSSLALRFFAFVFLRWIPGPPLANLVYTSLAIFLPAFVYVFLNTSPWEVISDTVRVTTLEVDPHDVPEIDPRYIDKDATAEPIEELVVEEEAELLVKDPRILRTLLTGLPSPSGAFWSFITLAFNLALVAMTADLIWRARLFYQAHDLSMARVGYVSDSTAKILVREPDLYHLPIFVSYRYADADSSWKAGGSIEWLDERTDFTSTVSLTGLKSDMRYQYSVSNNHTGFFTTAPRIGRVSARPINRGAFTFFHSSCVKYNFPYSLFQHPLSISGFRHVSQVLEGFKAQFMLFLGDFIYVDVPRRQAVTLEDYRREYRQTYASPDWPAASAELPWIHVYDDHEVENDWSGNETGVFSKAFDPYTHYHISANPAPLKPGKSYFSFTQGPATFFILDTRRYRSPNDKTNGSDPLTGEPTKTMLGEEQLSDLLSWLRRAEPAGVRWKIVVSSIPFTKNWWYGAQDTWRGYLGERQIILEAMWDVGLRGGVGVVVLSGDRHEFAATAFPPPPEGKEEVVGLGGGVVAANPFGSIGEQALLRTRKKKWPLSATVHEFSASPLNMFYLPVRTYAESSTAEDYVSDVCVKYIPDGNSKFGAVSISNPATSDQSVLHYRLFVDGVEAWSYMLTTPPEAGGAGRSKDAIWG